MAHTAHKTQEAMEEIEMKDEVIDQLAKETAIIIREAKKVVFFTGAGISTSAGVPDYRGPQGAWTLAAKGEKRTERTVSMSSALATPTHMALVELQRQGKLHFLISQNVDGLHRRSGIDPEKIAELHGNSTLEECNKCGHVVARDFMVHGRQQHFTGRSCVVDGCQGDYRDIIINFGENLPGSCLSDGFAHSEKADVHICLGTSLTVRPACDMPMATKDKGGKLVIVNLQRTPLDKAADVRVFGRTDFFMERVIFHLGMTLPPFVIDHRISVQRRGADLAVTGVLSDSTPQSSAESIKLNGIGVEYANGQNPLVIPQGATSTGDNILRYTFFAHYGEPTVELPLNYVLTGPEGTTEQFQCTFNPVAREMIVTAVSQEVAPLPHYAKGSKPRRMEAGVNKNIVDDGTGIDYSNWFAVTPLRHCEHCPQVSFKEGVTLDPKAPCGVCNNVGENMQCLICFEVFCGRHVNKHMLEHHEKTQHPMVVGFADLSFWCYPCESYIDPSNKHLNLIYRLLHNAKFGFEGPMSDQSRQSASISDAKATTTTSAEDPAPLQRVESDELEQGFSVNPLSDCVHCKYINKSKIPESVSPATSACGECGHVGENMVCLECFAVFCGRHQEAHMMDHHEETRHRIVMGFKDLSTWCYMCDNYLSQRNTDVAPHYNEMAKRKGFSPEASRPETSSQGGSFRWSQL